MNAKFYRSKVEMKVLEEQDKQDIFYTSLDVLERVGVKVFNEEALGIYKNGGCVIRDKNTVHIPSGITKKCLATLPERISIYDRSGKLSMVLENGRSYFGAGSDCPNFIDPYNQKRRRSNKLDVINAAKVADCLPEINFHMSLSMASDYSPELYYINQYVLMLYNTTKPLILTAKNKDNLKVIHEIASFLSGSKEDFKLKPNLILYDEPSTPLFHTEEALEKLIYSSEHHIPFIYSPCPMSGATAAVTKAATIVTAVCESISGIVLSQLINPGAPVIMGGVLSNFDMATAIMPYGSPELVLMSATLTEVAKYLKIPMFSTAGCSDAKILDEQAAIEATDSVLFAALSGANIIHDLGYLESGLTGCLEMLVMSNEIISKTKYILNGLEVNEDSFLRSTIEDVGPMGNFLTDESTINLFKREFYFSKLFNRDNYENWVNKGSKPFKTVLNEKVIEILENHKPPKLDKSIIKEIDKILDEYK